MFQIKELTHLTLHKKSESLYLHNSSRSTDVTPWPNKFLKNPCLGASGVSHAKKSSPNISFKFKLQWISVYLNPWIGCIKVILNFMHMSKCGWFSIKGQLFLYNILEIDINSPYVSRKCEFLHLRWRTKIQCMSIVTKTERFGNPANRKHSWNISSFTKNWSSHFMLYFYK